MLGENTHNVGIYLKPVWEAVQRAKTTGAPQMVVLKVYMVPEGSRWNAVSNEDGTSGLVKNPSWATSRYSAKQMEDAIMSYIGECGRLFETLDVRVYYVRSYNRNNYDVCVRTYISYQPTSTIAQAGVEVINGKSKAFLQVNMRYKDKLRLVPSGDPSLWNNYTFSLRWIIVHEVGHLHGSKHHRNILDNPRHIMNNLVTYSDDIEDAPLRGDVVNSAALRAAVKDVFYDQEVFPQLGNDGAGGNAQPTASIDGWPKRQLNNGDKIRIFYIYKWDSGHNERVLTCDNDQVCSEGLSVHSPALVSYALIEGSNNRLLCNELGHIDLYADRGSRINVWAWIKDKWNELVRDVRSVTFR